MMRPIVFMVPPAAPAAPAVMVDGAKAIVSFETPKATGGSPIEYYTVTVSPGGKKVTGLGSPILVEGLTPGQAQSQEEKQGLFHRALLSPDLAARTARPSRRAPSARLASS